MKADLLGALLKGQPDGKQMWVGSLRGSSMRPLLRGGESLKVVRCTQGALRPGDIAIMLRADGALIAHLVTSSAPFKTESFAGTPDAPGLEVLARAAAVRRGPVVIPLPSPVRPVLFGLQRAWRWAIHSPALRRVQALLVAAVSSERTGSLRSRLARSEIQILGNDTLTEVAVCLSHWVALRGDVVESLLREGVALGARRRGALVGLAFVGRDKVLRHAFLRRRAQGLGLELTLVERAIRESTARGLEVIAAEIDPLQPGFVAAARALGLDVHPPRRPGPA